MPAIVGSPRVQSTNLPSLLRQSVLVRRHWAEEVAIPVRSFVDSTVSVPRPRELAEARDGRSGLHSAYVPRHDVVRPTLSFGR